MLLEELLKKENIFNFFQRKLKEGNSLEESLVETCLYYSKTPDEVIDELREAAPPCKKAEDFIKDAKEDFKKRYGKRWEQVLYATAWKLFSDDPECKLKNKKEERKSNF